MAFVKIGDNAPIINVYDGSVNEILCPLCGKKLITIAIGKDENKLICESCELEENVND